MTKDVTGRENQIRCPKCHKQVSRTAYTPLHHLKLPLWTFSYLLLESIQLFPQLLPASLIQRKLSVSSSTSIRLKRRLQLFLSEFIPVVKHIITEDIKKEYGDDFRLPKIEDESHKDKVKNKSHISADTVALFSARERSNGFRKRHKHRGQTASIYLSDLVAKEKGEYQIGTLAHTIAVKRVGE